MPQATDFLLVQVLVGGSSPSQVVEASANYCRSGHLGLDLHRVAWCERQGLCYVYFRLQSRAVRGSMDFVALRRVYQSTLIDATILTVSRLECVFERAGYSHGAAAAFHYVVEMDPDEGWMPEISDWYDKEHMPGLASVPGCVLAMRMLNHDAGPYSLACYDLISDATLASPPWMAVRSTPWSEIARPHFTNTKRTMFSVVA